MSNLYLRIRNPGVADYRALTLLGASTTRYAAREGTIGAFGSGFKLSLGLLLREGLRPIVFTGNLRMEFFTKPEIINGTQFNRVSVKYSGKDVDGSTKNSVDDLGFSTEWGVLDWDDVRMAFREFVANAIDGAIASGGTHKDVEMNVVDNTRAKAGYTSVFLPYTPAIEKLYSNIDKFFLHFGGDHLLNRKIIPKQGDRSKTLIFKKGVAVCQLDVPSAFDYNLGDELRLDESRNASEWDVKYAVAQALRDAPPERMADILLAMNENSNIFEATLDSYYLKTHDETMRKKRGEVFARAFKAAAGEKGVVTSGKAGPASFIEAKGLIPFAVPGGWMEALEDYGLPTENVVLTRSEKEERQESEPTALMMETVEKIWKLLERLNLTNGKKFPQVKGFNPIQEGGSQVWGLYSDGVIYLHTDLGGKQLLTTALEECVHHITSAADATYDIESYLYRVIVELME